MTEKDFDSFRAILQIGPNATSLTKMTFPINIAHSVMLFLPIKHTFLTSVKNEKGYCCCG